MDYLRAGYRTSMYSFDPDSGLMVPFSATWYRAPEHAVSLGVRHQYASMNYHQGVQYPDQVGEVLGSPRSWSSGVAPLGVLGTNHCGADGQWVGPLSRLTSPIPDNSALQPICCARPNLILGRAAKSIVPAAAVSSPPLILGRAAKSIVPAAAVSSPPLILGRAAKSIVPAASMGLACGCSQCPGGYGAHSWTLIGAGFAGNVSNFNRLWTFLCNGDCNWVDPDTALSGTLGWSVFIGWFVQLFDPSHSSVAQYVWDGVSWNCIGPNHLNVSLITIGGSGPASIDVFPGP